MYPKHKLSALYYLPAVFASSYQRMKCIGELPDMHEYEKRKLRVFNQINFLGIVAGIFVSITGMFDDQELPFIASLVAFSPVLISSIVLLFNYQKKHETARVLYFSLYPVLTSATYAGGMDLGLELFFILYAALAVFYMQKPSNAIISYALAAGCYLTVYVFEQNYDYPYKLSATFFPFYVFIQILALFLLFFALYWLKRENVGYQLSILQKNEELYNTNLEIENQKKEIAETANELNRLNNLKDKLFSVISHDLRGPIYAQRNLFKSIHQYDLPGEQMKELVPEIISDMNYTVNLMDNLLQWSKSQMRTETTSTQVIDISEIINDVVKLLRLQAKAKDVMIVLLNCNPALVDVDRNMIDTVLRNLVSNAIKFTSKEGEVKIEMREMNNFVEISVHDTGVGMTDETLQKISQNIFYTTNGTSNESGTGLGLMLCSDFLQKNGSNLLISSEYGKGSIFSFKLPLQQECMLLS